MDRPLVCGVLCLLLCLVASASGGPAPDSPLTTDRRGYGLETADVSADVLPEVQLRQRSSPLNPVTMTHKSLRIRRQSNNNKKKKKRPNPGAFSALSVLDGVKVPSSSRTKRNIERAASMLMPYAP